MNNKYSKAPIIEAVCEFRFLQKDDWDWTIPGILYSKIKEEYPIKSELRGFGVDVKFDMNKREIGSGFSSNVMNKIEGMQFKNETGDSLIQIRENILSIHKNRPYISWEEFKPKIIKILNIYNDITHNDDILKIGLRYINSFENFPGSFTIEDYFNYHPTFPDPDQLTLGELIVKSTLPMPDEKKIEGIMNLLLFFNKPSTNSSDIKHILDLDMLFLKDKENLIKIDQVEDYLEKGHRYINETFESCITNKIRDIIN